MKFEKMIFHDSGLCMSCKHFYFEPGVKDKHYYLDESTGYGECLYLKVGVMHTDRSCQKWKMRK